MLSAALRCALRVRGARRASQRLPDDLAEDRTTREDARAVDAQKATHTAGAIADGRATRGTGVRRR